MSKPSRYVVVLELPTGYMDCVGIYENAEQAYGEAYLSLCEELNEDSYYITSICDREGENGCCLSRVNKDTGAEEMTATVLFYRKADMKGEKE